MRFLNHYLKEYSKDYMPPSIKWREKRVWHKTSSGEMNFIKVKSLPPEEQMKYKPMDLIKKNKKAEKLSNRIKMGPQERQSDQSLENIPQEKPRPKMEGEVFDFYIGIKDKSEYEELEKGKLLKGTLDSANAVDMEEDDDLKIVIARNVPVEAVKEYLDDEGHWKKIEEDDTSKKAEFVKFGENDYFKLDLFEYKDFIDFEMSEDDDEDVEGNDEDDKHSDGNDEIAGESMKEHEIYLMNKHLMFLYENGGLNLVNEETQLAPEVMAMARKIADLFGLDLKERQMSQEDMDLLGPKFKNSIFFSDKTTGSTFVQQLNLQDFVQTLKNVWKNIVDMRNKWHMPIPNPPIEYRKELENIA